MGETIWPGHYRRKVTDCKAMRVTTENLPQVAAWCGGHTWASAVVVPIYSDGKRGEDVAPIGSWVVQVGGVFRVWPAEAFTAATKRPNPAGWRVSWLASARQGGASKLFCTTWQPSRS